MRTETSVDRRDVPQFSGFQIRKLAEEQLEEVERATDEHERQKVRNQERFAAVLVRQARKPPNVSHSCNSNQMLPIFYFCPSISFN